MDRTGTPVLAFHTMIIASCSPMSPVASHFFSSLVAAHCARWRRTWPDVLLPSSPPGPSTALSCQLANSSRGAEPTTSRLKPNVHRRFIAFLSTICRLTFKLLSCPLAQESSATAETE
eukprot:496545-Hanusia_phi.AAC.1